MNKLWSMIPCIFGGVNVLSRIIYIEFVLWFSILDISASGCSGVRPMLRKVASLKKIFL